MAQKGQGILFVCRSCRQHLEKANVSTRSFSRSQQRQKSKIPILPKALLPYKSETHPDLLTDTEESSSNTIFPPNIVLRTKRAPPQLSRKSVYSISISSASPSSNLQEIKTPYSQQRTRVTVTLSNDEEVHLQPADRWDRPRKRKSLTKITTILGQSSGSEEWKNLPPFLEGMKQAQEKIPREFYEKITRKANEQNKSGIVVRCAEKVKTTDVSLSDAGVTRELMLGFHNRAATARFEGEEIEKAAKQAEHVALMMEEKEHCGGKLKDGQTDMRRDLTVLAVLLELNAAQAIQNNKIGSSSDEDEKKVVGYAKRVLAAVGEGVIPTSSTTTTMLESARQGQQLENLLPLWNGIKMALKVVTDRDLAQGLESRLKLVEKQVKKTVAEVKAAADGKPRRALIMYDQLQ